MRLLSYFFFCFFQLLVAAPHYQASVKCVWDTFTLAARWARCSGCSLMVLQPFVFAVEFGREKEALFDRQCCSKNVKDFDKLHDLVLLEEFGNCLPDRITTYINE